MKIFIGIIIALVIIGVGGWLLMGRSTTQPLTAETTSKDATVVSDGTYVILSEESTVSWAGKKPLIEGYINTGSIGVKEGTITVDGETATGTFVINMDTLSVSSTPTKPGKESALEGHLKGENWFSVEEFPTASFEITSITPRADSQTTFIYDVEGDLTMKGKTGTVTFPSTIYTDAEGNIHAKANFEIDRTKWGITANSDSFFDGLADNAIDDMVALSFHIVAEKK